MNQNAEYSAVNDAVRGQFFRRVWQMTTPYWRSEETVSYTHLTLPTKA